MMGLLREAALEYFEEFRPFFQKMCFLMAENDQVKGGSYMKVSEAYLLDRMAVQFEDMQNDPDREDYYANIGNYAAMLWIRNQSSCSSSEVNAPK